MSIELTITTPEGVSLQDEVEFVEAPAAAGDIGVLPGHSPMLSPLRLGQVAATVDGKVRRFAISGGFVEIHPKTMLILADTAESVEDIDVSRAQAAKERAERRLEEAPPGLDIPRAMSALARAVNRLEAAEEA